MQGHIDEERKGAFIIDDGPLRTSGLVVRAKGSRRMFAHTLLATPSAHSRPVSTATPSEPNAARVEATVPTTAAIALVITLFAVAIGGAVGYLIP